MQKDGSHDAGPSGLPESPSNHASSDGFQPSANMTNRLRNLAKWRIDHSSIEFPQEAREVSGGFAIVSRAFLASPSGIKDNTNQFIPTRNEGIDSGEPAGETSPRRKGVAVKKMKMSSDIARILGLTVREAEFLVGLSHENIIKLEGFVEDLSKDIIWLVFPWEENGTLRDFVASADWDIPERIHLIMDVVSGVEYLHSRRPPILHGDLKSINVLVNSECRAVITDFGSARHLKPEDLNKGTKPAQNKPPVALLLEATFCASTNTITLTGDHYTLRWAAPELLYEEEPSLCSDIWALGWVAYEVMTNCIPFQDVKDTIVIKRVIQGDLPCITGDTRMSLIQALCSLMLGCWNIEPSKRPTAEEFRKSINWMASNARYDQFHAIDRFLLQPFIIPNRIRNSDTAASRARSPELLAQLGSMHSRQGDYLSASDCFTKALCGFADAGNMEEKATALVQLGQVHRIRGEPDQAISFYSEALQICADIGNRQKRASALWGLAEVHRNRHEDSQAITFYSEALQIYADLGDRQGRAGALKSLADLHRLRGEYSKATTFFSEALQIYTDLGNREGRADALQGLADVHAARKEYSQAITFYSEVIQIHTEIGNRLGKACALRGLAEVHRLQNEFSQAITLLSEALQISTDIGNRFGRAFSLVRLAAVHRNQEDRGNAIRCYTEAAEVFEQIGDIQRATYASNQAAEVRGLPPKETLCDA